MNQARHMEGRPARDKEGKNLSDPFLCSLRQAKNIEDVGEKAYHLGHMMGQGVSVPSAFVITNAGFQLFLESNGLRKPIATLCTDLDVQDPECFREASQKIRVLILQARIPESICGQILIRCNEMLPEARLIVRSSAVGEDSGGASFAGQLDSFLNLNSAVDVNKALLACWASYWSERSLFYQFSRGISLNGMGVIIQEMIRSRVAGVLFTHAPGSSVSDKGRLLGEYCFGQGEALVSGRINPGRFTISRDGYLLQKQGEPEQSPDSGADAFLFRKCLVAELAETALALEKQFGTGQDIEWTLDQKGKLYIVQSRPITGPLKLPDQNQTEPPMVVWSNANVSENFPEPISPLLFSIASTGYYYYFRNLGRAFGLPLKSIEAMENPLRNIIGLQGARMYYNLTNIHALIRLLPFGQRLTEHFNLFVGASQMTTENRGHKPGKQNRISRLLELVRITTTTLWQYLFLSKRVAVFERIVSVFSEETRPEKLANRSLPRLLKDFRAFLEIRFHRWTNAGLADVAAMVGYGTLKKLLNSAFPEANQASLHNTLLKGLPGIVSSIPALRIWELSRQIREAPSLMTLFMTNSSEEITAELERNEEFAFFHKDLNIFLDEWGFRCSGELMLTLPSFQEDQAPLIDILKGYLSVKGESPDNVVRRQGDEREAKTNLILRELSTRKVFRFLPLLNKGHLLKFILVWTHRAIAFRERARLKQALLYSRCRRIVLAIGGKLCEEGHIECRDDIFFLKAEELKALTSGSALLSNQIRDLVATRKKEHVVQSALSPPDTLTLAEGEYFAETPQNEINRDPLDQGYPSAQGKRSDLLSGIGACGGQVTGPATILQEVTESRRLTAGDVLVTRQTDPGWGPVFFLIRGLVLERGGMLSHGAIIAREYGIPCVVGVPDATHRIPEGKPVFIDGDSGHVRPMD
ncbi:MAG: PEP/pyruvate-binding domain-containing protein [Nitrospiria bacterium]